MRVLIVDDEKNNLALISRTLRKYDIDTVPAENGAEAIKILSKDKKFNAIITDILMPEMDGFSMLIKIREDDELYSLPVLVYSATYTEKEDEHLAAKLGANAFLKKPANTEELIAALLKIINDKNNTKKLKAKGSRSTEIFKSYNERLIKKLESKLTELRLVIEERDKAIAKGKIESEKYRTLFNLANDAFILLYQKQIVDINKKTESLLGLTKENLIGKFFWELSPEYQIDGKSSVASLSSKMDEALKEGQVVFNWSVLTPDDEPIEVEIGMSKIEIDDELYFMMALRDLRERNANLLKLRAAYNEIRQLKEQLESENLYLKEEINQAFNFENIITVNEKFKKILSHAGEVAQTDSTVLILGETGTGKELLARAIHQLSNRSTKPLIKVNCAAIPEALIESELFGHEKGAFTGALKQRIGKFEMANSGTLFLDEIGDLPLGSQTKLLRVLQEGEIERIGGAKTVKVDVRIIAATNRDLEKMVERGEFRQDLFFRLNVFPLNIPPLRERKDDIPILVENFVEHYSKKLGKVITKIPSAVMEKFLKYDWPGNIRELENIVERAVVLSKDDKLLIGEWFKATKKQQKDKFVTLEEFEKEYIIDVLKQTGGKVSGKGGAAEILGMKPTTLRSRMDKLGIK